MPESAANRKPDALAPEPRKLRFSRVLGAGLLALLGGFGAGYALHDRDIASRSEARPAPREAASGEANRFKIPVSMTQPSRGPEDALVTIVEWCDLRGSACRDVDAPMQALMRKYEGKLRWVHRQLPDPSQQDSALLHHFARGAFMHGGKFWEVRERLLRTRDGTTLTNDDLRAIAGELGLDWAAIARGLEDRTFARYVGVDILFAGKFGVNTAPVFFVNGRRAAPAAANELKGALSKLIDEEMAEAMRRLDQGVARADVYRVITEDGLWSVDDDPVARRAASANRSAGTTKGP
jgi:protein-disulfide isomerase